MLRAYTRNGCALLILAFSCSCTDGENSAASPTGGTGGRGMAMNAAATAGISGASGAVTLPTKDDGEPTWSNIFTFEFRSCRVVNCHGGGTAGIDMTSKDAAWDSLVNEPANPKGMCAQLGKERIVPGEPDESLLYLKLDINAPCGQQMPAGGQLSKKARDRVKAWIEMGAGKE